MLNIIEKNTTSNKQMIKLSEMQPLQVGRIMGDARYQGNIVMRTASNFQFEVMNLTNPVRGSWTSKSSEQFVELLDPGEVITIEVFNEIKPTL